MIALYIVLGILAFLFLVLFSSISLIITVDPNFSLVVKFWFLKFKFPAGSEKKPKKARSKPQKNEQPKEKKGYIKQSLENNGLLATVTELFELLKSVFSEFGRSVRHLNVKKFKLIVNVASEDPALTAVEYGAVCSVVFPMVRLIEDKTNFNRNGAKVTVNSDFKSTKPELRLDAKCKLRIAFGLTLGFRLLMKLIKRKMNQQIKQENDKKQNNGTK